MQSDSSGHAREGHGVFVFSSRPNRSLSRAQQRAVFWVVAIPCLGFAAFFAVLGYWLTLPFAGLEVGLLAWAFESLREREGDFETITLEDDRMILEWRAAGVSGRREFNRHWVSVVCECGGGDHDCRLGLRSHGITVALGRHLTDLDRRTLATRLRECLAQRT